MIKTTVLVAMLFCLLGVAAEGHGANIAYVTDSFEITLRTGPSTDNKIMSTPQSAQPLEVLEVQGDWSRVRTVKKGGEPTEGWVLSRYLIHRLPWELRSRSLSEENSSLKDRLAALQKACDEVSQSEKGLAANLEENKRAFQSLQTEHESLKSGATEYLKLKAEHKVASSKLESQEKTIEELTAQNRQLESSQRNRSVCYGRPGPPLRSVDRGRSRETVQEEAIVLLPKLCGLRLDKLPVTAGSFPGFRYKAKQVFFRRSTQRKAVPLSLTTTFRLVPEPLAPRLVPFAPRAVRLIF